MKKIISLLLSGVLFVGAMVSVSAAENFTDFSESDYSWAYDSVMEMVELGYITGYDDNTFRPDNGVTRLEVMALFSRAMGALQEDNKEVIASAVDKYEETLKPFKLPWGTEEISYLLYRDVLSVQDLTTYLEGELKNEPMPRYEAAIIITKAMGGKKAATSSQSVTLDYTDFRDIPSNSLQYVKYVADNGVMTGMEDGSFSPMTSVLRCQMAVMLSRVVAKMQYSFIIGKLTAVDVNGRIVSVADADDVVSKYMYLDNVIMKVGGEETVPKSMVTGVRAVVTLSNNKIAFIDTLTTIPDVTVSGVFQSRATTAGVTRITVKNNETQVNESYECSPTVVVEYNGEPSSLSNFKLNDYITLEAANGIVEKIIGETKVTTVSNAIIEKISIEPDFTLTISHAKEEYDGVTYPIASDVSVLKNNDITDFSSVYVGDRAVLTLTYGVVTSISATSTEKTTEGTIKEIIISATPSITVASASGESKYAVANDVAITVNGEAGSLYDFRMGDSVKLTLESQTVTKISTTTAQSASGKLEGVITAVNTSYGFVRVSYTNSDNYTVEETVYCKDATTTILDAGGVTKKMKDLAEGQTVTVHGTTSNGAFTAKIIIISA